MGRKIPYFPAPKSPEAGMKGQKGKCLLGGCVALIITSLSSIIFLALFLRERLSDPAAQLQACRSELENQTSQGEARLTSAQVRMETLEKGRAVAQGEARGLRTQLAAANRSLAEIREGWETCTTQMKTLESNVTSQVAEAVRKETEKCKTETQKLHQQILDKTQELQNAQNQIQTKENQCSARIQTLNDRLMKLSSGSSRVDFIFPGFSFFFFLLLLI